MSHVTTIDLDIRDLDALDAAARSCGLRLERNQKTYHWWGSHVGDYPIPDGFSEEDLGKCDHALVRTDGVSKRDTSGYEIGVVKRRDGRPGFTLLWDFMDRTLVKGVGGQAGDTLRQAYATEVAAKKLMQEGYAVTRHRLESGAVEVRAVRH